MSEYADYTVKVVTKVSKNGVQYKVLEIQFPNGYSKIVFLDKAEQFLCE